MRDWLITARKLITQNSPIKANQNIQKKTIIYLCTYIDQLAVNNCQLYIISHNIILIGETYSNDNYINIVISKLRTMCR